tara:strand:+ start:384 stop:782 length:399 start_codon:yes stop_codon:yes gene_type:complete
MNFINLIPWILMLLITLTWTVGVIFKPKAMGGSKSWGPVNFKISILWWLSIIFIFLTKFSPFNFILMVPAAFIIVSSTSKKAEVDYAIKNNLPPESILTRKQPNTEALVPSLIAYFLFLLFLYMVNSWFVSS